VIFQKNRTNNKAQNSSGSGLLHSPGIVSSDEEGEEGEEGEEEQQEVRIQEGELGEGLTILEDEPMTKPVEVAAS